VDESQNIVACLLNYGLVLCAEQLDEVVEVY
jgi:hypothetical protein